MGKKGIKATPCILQKGHKHIDPFNLCKYWKPRLGARSAGSENGRIVLFQAVFVLSLNSQLFLIFILFKKRGDNAY